MNNLMMVVTHKQCDIIKEAPYRPVIVGKGEFEMEKAWRDNSGDNIAEKNPYYCELTALYWVWKNQAENFDNIGLCHYRRFLTKDAASNAPEMLLTGEDIEKDLQRYDVILPRPFIWPVSLDRVYYDMGVGKKKDLDSARQAISTLYPEYADAFDKTVSSRKASYCNMFVLPREKFNAYCQWLFSILQYVEDRMDMTGYTVQEQRVYGYLSEILLNVWVKHNKLRIKYYPIAYMELSAQEQKEKAREDRKVKLRMTIRNLIK